MSDYLDETLPEAAFSLTVKSGKGYDAAMLTIRGQNYDEFIDHANSALTFEVVTGILEAVRHVPQDAVAQTPPPNNGGGSPAPQNPPQAPPGGGDWKAQAPDCIHGRRQAVAYTPKSGPKQGVEQYAYMCPQPREVPRDQKCTPIDAISGKEWGAK